MPVNHNQLNLLTSAQSTAIDAALAARSLKVAELVKVYWPSTDNPKVYSWWNCLADPVYTTPLTAWLAGAPLVPGFVAQDRDKAERFHNIPRTAALSDDVISMRFANYGRTFETLCYKWKGGVKVEVFYFFPEIANDATSTAYTAISWFLGHLRKLDRANDDYADVTVRNGFRSPHVLIPSRIQGSNCQWYFNGEHNPGIADNPCDYDRHLSGSRGLLNGGSPFTSCKHDKTDCLARMGDLESYGGDDYVTESTQIGRGDHRTISRTVGNEIRLENLRVVYGQRHVKALQLKRFAKEYNPSEDHQDKGTIRTVFAVSEGPIKSITAVKVMDRDLPRSDGLGLETRFGTQRQAATTYSADMLNLNRTAHFRGDINPVDPTGVQASDIVGECVAEGRSTVNVYAAGGSYSQSYTNNRADCMMELLVNQWFGYRMDVARVYLQDIVDLRAYNSPFDADVQARTIQQQIEDICLAAVGTNSPGWFRPFVYNGKWRFLPIIQTDLTLADIPQIKSDFGSTRNVLFDRSRNVPRIEPEYRDNDDIPNAYTVTIEDAARDNIERPLTFNADLEQYYEGTRFGDKSKRRDPRTVAGYGLTAESPARVMGEFLVKMGPFATGGLYNNCSVTFVIPAVSSLALNLHENKILKLPIADNDRLNPYLDTLGAQFQYFLVTGMRRTSRLELEVSCQAWSDAFWAGFCFVPGGTASGYVTWPAGDPDAVDGPHGVRTRMYPVTEGREVQGYTYPSSIDQATVTLDSWTHTIDQIPGSPGAYFVTNHINAIGYLIHEDGAVWIYRESSVDFATTLPAGSVGVGTTLGIEWDKNGGAPVRRYKKNGVTILTDTGAAPTTNQIGSSYSLNKGYVGDIYWTVTYTGCVADYSVQPVGQSGTGTTNTTAGYGLTPYGDNYGR